MSIDTKYNTIQTIGLNLCKNEGLKVNHNLNRYNNIVPYDYNRIIINSNTNNYINASKIQLEKCPYKYIATQAPLSNTINTFW